MRSILRFILAFVLAFLVGRSMPAWASHTPKGQVFSATETEVVADLGEAPPVPTSHKAKRARAAALAAPVAAALAAPVAAAPATAATDPAQGTSESVSNGKANYDLVPSEQKEPIVERLKICEELIHKYGRAYDYRVHTLKELQGILAQLERPAAANAPVTIPKAAPAPSADGSENVDIGQPAPESGSDI